VVSHRISCLLNDAVSSVEASWFYREERRMEGCRNVGRVWGRAHELRKVGARAPESKKGPKKGPKKFSRFIILRIFETLVPP